MGSDVATGETQRPSTKECIDFELYYEGEKKSGWPHGYGTYRYEYGTYKGYFHMNKWHGKGKLIYKYGPIYEGEWYLGERHGEGQYTWHNGAVWRGVFDMNKPYPDEAYRAATAADAAAVQPAATLGGVKRPLHP